MPFRRNTTHFLHMKGLHHGCGAYVISRRCAASALAALSQFTLPVDDILFGGRDTFGAALHRYQQVPASVVQDCILPVERRSPELASLIEGERQIAISKRPAAPRVGTLANLAHLAVRIPMAAGRRLFWNYARIPWAGGALDD